MTMPKPPTSLTSPPKDILGSDRPLHKEENLPSTTDRTGELDRHEYGYILDKVLKPRHRKNLKVIAFIDAFVRCKSIEQASHEAVIPPKQGYSYRHRVDIARAIQQIWDKSTVKYGMDATEIFERVKEVVDFDPISMQNADGTFKSNLHDIKPEARRNLKKLKVKNLFNQVEDKNGIKSKIIIGEVIEYEFYDKLKASELVGKEKEMFKNTTKVEHTVSNDMQNLLLESVSRANERKMVEAEQVIDVTPERADEDT